MTDATMQSSPRPALQTNPAARNVLPYLFALLLAATCLAGTARAQTQPFLDVPYVPTPPHVVERMFEIAAVQPGEFVIDLGCGDGRMVVAAASKFNARGLGVDIDPERIREATANAERAGVTDKVEFRIGDLFETDISQADVLAIYLLDSVNLRLRPKILETMRPGARVVSHAFNMGEWEPDLVEKVEGRTLYLWHVPARVAGGWQIAEGERVIDLNIRQNFQQLSGSAAVGGRMVPLREGRVRGTEISFQLEVQPGETRTFHGRVNGDRIVALGTEAGPWQGQRRAL